MLIPRYTSKGAAKASEHVRHRCPSIRAKHIPCRDGNVSVALIELGISRVADILENMPPPRFAADAMLGRLARWLRVLGFDTSYDAALADAALVRLAHDEGRILLTRDRHLLRELRPARAHEVRRDDPLDQLRELVAALDLPPPTELFTRCMLCNTVLSPPLEEHEWAPLLSPCLSEVHGPVRRCPACGKVYWHGSHVRRMREALGRGVPGWLA
jgi:uncharacterized protein